MADPEVAIEVEQIEKSFGAVRALCGVTLSSRRATVLALLGPNGAGKTTLVRILTTLLAPDSGRARVAGLDVVRDASAPRHRIGLAGRYAAVDENLTGLGLRAFAHVDPFTAFAPLAVWRYRHAAGS